MSEPEKDLASSSAPVASGGGAPAAADAPPVAATGEPARRPARWLAWAVWLALALAVVALAWTASVAQRLSKTQEEMARRSADTLAEAATARTLAQHAESLSKELVARLGVAELRLSEVSLQRSQLEELMLSVSRSRDDSLVQDLEAALRLAVQQSQLTGSAQPLISALQGAEQRIERAAQPRLNPVQRAIARDIERLRAAELADVPALALRLDELLRQVDEWPLRNAPLVLSEPASTRAEPPAPSEEPSPAAEAESTPAEPEAPGGMLARGWQRFDAWRRAAWDRWWAHVREGTADLIRVSRIDQPEAALLAPEQSFFLRENLKLTLLNARLALLGRQFETARADVRKASELVRRYFDEQAVSTRLALQTLAQLEADMRQDTLPRPDETLAALAVAASGR
jgi:uroporphyrin-3 C-methyltransferase